MDGGILRGILLIIAMLALGGIIAFVGDRVGSKAGKARLRLGKLRPRQTASLVTIATGTLTAAIVTSILLATSKSLREGIFRIREINQELAQTKQARDRAVAELESIRSDLDAAETSKTRIQQELDEAEAAKTGAQQDLNRLGSKLRAERAEARQLRAAIGGLQSEIGTLTQGREDLVAERERLQGEIEVRDRELASREEEIDNQERALQNSAARLSELETQRQNLTNEIRTQEEEIKDLARDREQLEQGVRELAGQLAQSRQELAQSERNFNRLREEGAALERGEAIVSVGIQVGPTLSAREAVDRVLSLANREAFRRLFPRIGDEQPVIVISEDDVERLRADIADGGRYVISVFSADTYLQYDPNIKVVIARIPDAEVFGLGDVVATVRVAQDRARFRASLTEHMENLNISTLSRAKDVGMLVRDIVYDDDDNLDTFLSFVERLRQLKGPVDSIEAVAREQIFLSGPLKVDLIARYQGQVVLSSKDLPSVGDGPADESALNQ